MPWPKTSTASIWALRITSHIRDECPWTHQLSKSAPSQCYLRSTNLSHTKRFQDCMLSKLGPNLACFNPYLRRRCSKLLIMTHSLCHQTQVRDLILRTIVQALIKRKRSTSPITLMQLRGLLQESWMHSRVVKIRVCQAKIETYWYPMSKI